MSSKSRTRRSLHETSRQRNVVTGTCFAICSGMFSAWSEIKKRVSERKKQFFCLKSRNQNGGGDGTEFLFSIFSLSCSLRKVLPQSSGFKWNRRRISRNDGWSLRRMKQGVDHWRGSKAIRKKSENLIQRSQTHRRRSQEWNECLDVQQGSVLAFFAHRHRKEKGKNLLPSRLVFLPSISWNKPAGEILSSTKKPADLNHKSQ